MSEREEAIKLLEEAAERLEKAGMRELLPSLAYKVENRGDHWDWGATSEDGYFWAEAFECSVCGDDSHYAVFRLKKPKELNFQMALEVEIGLQHRSCSLWNRIKEGLREFWSVVKRKETVCEVSINRNDLTKFRDLARKL